MKTHFLIASAALIIGAVSARAADAVPYGQPAYQRPLGTVEAGAFDWTGFYAGISAGYGFGGQGRIDTTGQAAPNIANIAGGARPGTVNLDRNGAIAGGQIGYNYQYNDLVIGYEADLSATGINDTRTIGTAALGTGLALNNSFSSSIDYLGTLRGRVGYAVDRSLFYATAGLAFGQTRQSVDMLGAAGQTQFTGSQSQTKLGFAVGAGLEQAITDNITFKAEYLYYNLGSDRLNVAVVPGSGGGGTGYDSVFNNDGHILRAGFNYKFN